MSAVVLEKPVVHEPTPGEVEMIISSLEAGKPSFANRRSHPRLPYCVEADLQLFVDSPGTSPWKLYIRDACPRGLGFVTQHRLPLGYGGVIELPAPDGSVLKVHCTLLRCREVAPGWFDGALYFNRAQPVFESTNHRLPPLG